MPDLRLVSTRKHQLRPLVEARISGLRIETYFQQIEKIIDACLVIQLSNVTYEKRGTYEGFIREKLCFADGSAFYLHEFVDVEMTPDRLMYAYQFIDPSQKLVFRYDNTGHHKKFRSRQIV